MAVRALPVLLLVLLSALGGGARAEQRIVFATDWKAEAEQGGFYQALAKGFYKRRGLDVVIRQGGPGSDNQRLLAAGAVDMAIGSNDFFALNLVQAGAAVRAVLAVFQKDPQILMTHRRDDIAGIADMKGKPIMIGAGAITTMWAWLKAKHGFEDSQIRKYTFNLAPFLVDPQAIQQGYASAEPFMARKEGVEPKVFLLADDGYPTYACLVLAPQSWIDDKPAVVQAFVDATIEGWKDYLYGDPAPGNALIKRDNPDETDELIAYGIETMKRYGIVTGGDAATAGIGVMTDARWKEFFDSMVTQAIYPADLDFRAAYTLQFLPK